MDNSKLLDVLRGRGQPARADWVDRKLLDRIDTIRNAGLLVALGLAPADLADEPSR
jgi:hypothetical protein